MHDDSIHRVLAARLHAASPIQGRSIRSVAVKVDQSGQTVWVTITDRTDTSEPTDHLFSFSWTDDLIEDSLIDAVIRAYLYAITNDEYAARELSPHLGMGYRAGGQQ